MIPSNNTQLSTANGKSQINMGSSYWPETLIVYNKGAKISPHLIDCLIIYGIVIMMWHKS